MNSQKALIIFFNVCAISFLLIIITIDACKESEIIGRIIAIKGIITVNETQTRLNAPLCLGDVIHTGPDSRADVKLLDSNTVFRVEQQAELRLLGSLTDRRSFIDHSSQSPNL